MPARSRLGLRVGDSRHCSVTMSVLRSATPKPSTPCSRDSPRGRALSISWNWSEGQHGTACVHLPHQ
jgi:hypothetical protein